MLLKKKMGNDEFEKYLETFPKDIYKNLKDKYKL